jgi:hypothetical protein
MNAGMAQRTPDTLEFAILVHTPDITDLIADLFA